MNFLFVKEPNDTRDGKKRTKKCDCYVYKQVTHVLCLYSIVTKVKNLFTFFKIIDNTVPNFRISILY